MTHDLNAPRRCVRLVGGRRCVRPVYGVGGLCTQHHEEDAKERNREQAQRTGPKGAKKP